MEVERRFSLSQCNYYPSGVRDKEIYLLDMFALIWTDMSSYNLHCGDCVANRNTLLLIHTQAAAEGSVTFRQSQLVSGSASTRLQCQVKQLLHKSN